MSKSCHSSRWIPLHHTWDSGFTFPTCCLQREPSAPGCSWPYSSCSPAPLQPFLRAEQQNCNHKRKNKNSISPKGERWLHRFESETFIFFLFQEISSLSFTETLSILECLERKNNTVLPLVEVLKHFCPSKVQNFIQIFYVLELKKGTGRKNGQRIFNFSKYSIETSLRN